MSCNIFFNSLCIFLPICLLTIDTSSFNRPWLIIYCFFLLANLILTNIHNTYYLPFNQLDFDHSTVQETITLDSLDPAHIIHVLFFTQKLLPEGTSGVVVIDEEET